LKVLLIEQRPPAAEDGAPMSIQHALPGDLIWQDESLDDAAQRVLYELTRLDGIYMKQFHAFGDPNRVREPKDQVWLQSFRNQPEARVLTVAYYGLVSLHEHTPVPASFAGSTNWIDISDMPDLAFDHDSIVAGGFHTLKEQLESHYISFELLPKKFTLSQLQTLHEIVLNKKLDKRNFRKNVKRMSHVVPLDEKQTGVLHKPAQLFSFEPDSIEE
jgi:8-oxo-dGTP diphosphatase